MANGQRTAALDSMRRLFDSGTAIGLSDRQLLDRFIAGRDETAFEAIVRRHGPMVLGVCRRAIADQDDVDDAFQATFLILVRRAGSIRDRDVLGTWLYGVARRVAVRASASARRRRGRERVMAENIEVKDHRVAGAEHNEIRSLIDAELERLPTRFRDPVILCDVQGQTHEQAAAQIGCPVGTVKSRLARGRERLKARLVRGGLTPSLAVLASFFAAERASAVPPPLIELTISAAAKLAAGSALVAAALTPEAAALTKGVILAMVFKKLGIVAAAVSVAFLVTGVTAFLLAPMKAAQQQKRAVASNRDAPASSPGLPKDRGDATDAQDWSIPEVKGVERFRLANGLKVMLRPIKGAKDVALIVVYDIGCDHDPAGRSGLAHLVEHVYVTAAAGDAKARTVEEFAARYPNGANGQTGDRYTVFSTVFPAKDVDREIADAAARIADLRVTTADLEREKPRLLQELDNMFVRFPALAAQNNARELIRPTPRGGRHGGVPDHVKAITLDDLHTFWKRFYKPTNAIVALAGDIDVAAVRKAIEERFAKVTPGEEPPAPGVPAPQTFAKGQRRLVASPSAARTGPVACVAYPAPAPNSELYAPFLVIAARFWAGAEKLGDDELGGMPVYFTPVDDGAVLAVRAGVKNGESPPQTLTRLETFVRETLKPPLDGRELAGAREQLGFLLGTAEIPDQLLAQNPYGVCFSLARREQLGLDAGKLDQALAKLTDNDIRRAEQAFFDPGRRVEIVVSKQE